MELIKLLFSPYGLIGIVVLITAIYAVPHMYFLVADISNASRCSKYRKKHPDINTVDYAEPLSETRSDLAVYSVNGERPAYLGNKLVLPIGEVEIIADYCERPQGHPRFKEIPIFRRRRSKTGRNQTAPLTWYYTDMQRRIAINKLERPENAKKPYFIIKFEVKPDFEYTFNYKYYDGILSVNARDPETFRFTTVAEDSKLDPEEPIVEEPMEKVFH